MPETPIADDDTDHDGSPSIAMLASSAVTPEVRRSTGERLAVLETLYVSHERADGARHEELKGLVEGCETRTAGAIANLEVRMEAGQSRQFKLLIAQMFLIALAFVALVVLAGKTLGVSVNAGGAVINGGGIGAPVLDAPASPADMAPTP